MRRCSQHIAAFVTASLSIYASWHACRSVTAPEGSWPRYTHLLSSRRTASCASRSTKASISSLLSTLAAGPAPAALTASSCCCCRFCRSASVTRRNFCVLMALSQHSSSCSQASDIMVGSGSGSGSDLLLSRWVGADGLQPPSCAHSSQLVRQQRLGRYPRRHTRLRTATQRCRPLMARMRAMSLAWHADRRATVSRSSSPDDGAAPSAGVCAMTYAAWSSSRSSSTLSAHDLTCVGERRCGLCVMAQHWLVARHEASNDL